MKNILIPRINYSPLYHHVDWLQEQIFNTKNISSNPHDKRKPSTKFPRPRDFFLPLLFVFSKLHRIFALLCNSSPTWRLETMTSNLKFAFYILYRYLRVYP